MNVNIKFLEEYMEKSDIYDLICDYDVEDHVVDIDIKDLLKYLDLVSIYYVLDWQNRYDVDEYYEYFFSKIDSIQDILEIDKGESDIIDCILYDKPDSCSDEFYLKCILYLISNGTKDKTDLDDELVEFILKYTINNIFIYYTNSFDCHGEQYDGFEPEAIDISENIVNYNYMNYEDIIMEVFLEKFKNFCTCHIKYKSLQELKTKYPEENKSTYYKEGLTTEDDYDFLYLKEAIEHDCSLVFSDKNSAMYNYAMHVNNREIDWSDYDTRTSGWS